jgi:1-phosphatidylinositol phosphodiesterase
MRTRIFMLMGALAVLYSSLATSVETNICITNKSRQRHIIKVPAVDGHDWNGERPDHNFNNISISSGSTVCRREDINYFSNPQFSFMVDGTETWLYYKSGSWISKQLVDKPNALYGTGEDYQRSSKGIEAIPRAHLPGGPCDGTRCSAFVIRGEPINSEGEVASPHNWMDKLDDNTSLANITIPGTHDSAAYQGEGQDGIKKFTFYTQYAGTGSGGFKSKPKMSIFNQLQSGVRFIDARVWKVNNRCKLHHNKQDLGQSCDHFFSSVYRWLTDNPTETVVMSIKSEGGIDNGKCPVSKDTKNENCPIEHIVNNIIDVHQKYWYIGDMVPTLGKNTVSTNLSVEREGTNVRGRIVLIRRYGMEYYTNPNKDGTCNWQPINRTSDCYSVPRYKSKSAYGLDASNWPSNDDAYGPSNSWYYAQDKYYVATQDKWDYVSHTLNLSTSSFANGLIFFNFASGYFGLIPDPYLYAAFVNAQLKSFLMTSPPLKYYGILAVDFITPELAKMIYSKNFPGGWGSN